MTSKLTVCRVLAVALISAIFFTNQLTYAQNPPGSSQSSHSGQQPVVKPSDQNADQNTEQQAFTGVIAKSGDRLVLTDPLTKTSYQLDDQTKGSGARKQERESHRRFGSLDGNDPRERDRSSLRGPRKPGRRT